MATATNVPPKPAPPPPPNCPDGMNCVYRSSLLHSAAYSHVVNKHVSALPARFTDPMAYWRDVTVSSQARNWQFLAACYVDGMSSTGTGLLPELAAIVISYLAPASMRLAFLPRLRESAVGAASATASKFGGSPFLSRNEQWPNCPDCGRALRFFVQLRLDELPEEVRYVFRPSVNEFMPGANRTGNGPPPTADSKSPATLSRVVPALKPELLQLFSCYNNSSDTVPHPPQQMCESYNHWAQCRLLRIVDLTGEPDAQPVHLNTLRIFGPELLIREWQSSPDCPDWSESKDYLPDADRVPLELLDECEGVAGMSPIPKDKVSGFPAWIQAVNYATCELCYTRMDLILDFSGEWTEQMLKAAFRVFPPSAAELEEFSSTDYRVVAASASSSLYECLIPFQSFTSAVESQPQVVFRAPVPPVNSPVDEIRRLWSASAAAKKPNAATAAALISSAATTATATVTASATSTTSGADSKDGKSSANSAAGAAAAGRARYELPTLQFRKRFTVGIGWAAPTPMGPSSRSERESGRLSCLSPPEVLRTRACKLEMLFIVDYHAGWGTPDSIETVLRSTNYESIRLYSNSQYIIFKLKAPFYGVAPLMPYTIIYSRAGGAAIPIPVLPAVAPTYTGLSRRAEFPADKKAPPAFVDGETIGKLGASKRLPFTHKRTLQVWIGDAYGITNRQPLVLPAASNAATTATAATSTLASAHRTRASNAVELANSVGDHNVGMYIRVIAEHILTLPLELIRMIVGYMYDSPQLLWLVNTSGPAGAAADMHGSRAASARFGASMFKLRHPLAIWSPRLLGPLIQTVHPEVEWDRAEGKAECLSPNGLWHVTHSPLNVLTWHITHLGTGREYNVQSAELLKFCEQNRIDALRAASESAALYGVVHRTQSSAPSPWLLNHHARQNSIGAVNLAFRNYCFWFSHDCNLLYTIEPEDMARAAKVAVQFNDPAGGPVAAAGHRLVVTNLKELAEHKLRPSHLLPSGVPAYKKWVPPTVAPGQIAPLPDLDRAIDYATVTSHPINQSEWRNGQLPTIPLHTISTEEVAEEKTATKSTRQIVTPDDAALPKALSLPLLAHNQKASEHAAEMKKLPPHLRVYKQKLFDIECSSTTREHEKRARTAVNWALCRRVNDYLNRFLGLYPHSAVPKNRHATDGEAVQHLKVVESFTLGMRSPIVQLTANQTVAAAATAGGADAALAHHQLHVCRDPATGTTYLVWFADTRDSYQRFLKAAYRSFDERELRLCEVKHNSEVERVLKQMALKSHTWTASMRAEKTEFAVYVPLSDAITQFDTPPFARWWMIRNPPSTDADTDTDSKSKEKPFSIESAWMVDPKPAKTSR